MFKKIARKIIGTLRLDNYNHNVTLELAKNPFLTTFVPGHFYSPLPDMNEILSKQEKLFDRTSRECLGIDIQEDNQLQILDRLEIYYNELNFPDRLTESHRYYYQNDFFSYADAIILYGMLRHFRPKQVVEVGSGFSSAVMLDTNDNFLDKQSKFTFIEPYPDRLFNLLSETDKIQHNIIAMSVQDVELSVFESLEAGDILFIDSSHVVKVGSDVCYLIFEVFPRLKPGVIIHVHDILWPFEYPKVWLEEGRAWNEAYFLRCFLQFNLTFQILYFNSFMGLFHKDKLEQKIPLCLKNTGGSMWMKKVN
jgi:predicted O-methyltransferase YrrM